MRLVAIWWFWTTRLGEHQWWVSGPITITHWRLGGVYRSERGRGGRGAGSAGVGGLLALMPHARHARVTELAEGARLDLAHPLAGHPEEIADFGQRPRRAVDAEASPQDLFFAFLESAQLLDEGPTLERGGGGIEG